MENSARIGLIAACNSSILATNYEIYGVVNRYAAEVADYNVNSLGRRALILSRTFLGISISYCLLL